MAKGYNLNDLNEALVNYLEANRDELVSKTIFNSHASDLFTLQTGVKSPVSVVRVDIETPLKSGASCGFEANGEDTFTDRFITPVALSVQKEFCTKDLINSWKAKDIAFTAGRETMPFEQYFLEKIAENISVEVENLLMNGDTSGSNGDLMDGLVTIINNDITDGVIPAGNVISKGSDDILTRCQKLWAACSPQVMKNAEIWMSIGMYKALIMEITNSNNYNVYVVDNGEFVMTLPSTNTVIRGISSIDDNADIIMMFDPKNVVKSVDLENNTEVFDFWYSKDDQVFKLNWFGMFGVQTIMPDEIYVNE